MENFLPEFCQVSIVRYNGLIEHNHLLEIENMKKQAYIDKLETMILKDYRKDARSNYVWLDKETIKEVMELEEPIAEGGLSNGRDIK